MITKVKITDGTKQAHIYIELWGDSAGYYAQCEYGGYVYIVESEHIGILNIFNHTENENDLYMDDNMVYSGTSENVSTIEKEIYKALVYELLKNEYVS